MMHKKAVVELFPVMKDFLVTEVEVAYAML